jgi:hypothetical protein
MQLFRGFPSKSRFDTRTQTEGPSPYWYSLSTTRRQADTTSTGTWKATGTTSRRTSNESVRVTSQILLVGVLVMSHDMSHSLCVMGVYDEVRKTVPMIVRKVSTVCEEKHNTMCHAYLH